MEFEGERGLNEVLSRKVEIVQFIHISEKVKMAMKSIETDFFIQRHCLPEKQLLPVGLALVEVEQADNA